MDVCTIEKHFYRNLHHASIPVYVLINRLSLVNMVYINNAVMEYTGYENFRVESLCMKEGEENENGHYVLSVVRYKDDIGVRMGESCNYYYK